MRIGSKPRRRLPAALKLVLAVIVVAAIAYPFRLPPMSRARSLTFYETDGSDTARMLRELPDEMRCDIGGAGGMMHVNARIEAPKLDKVPVLRVKQGGLDAERIETALGMQADNVEIADEGDASYNYLQYHSKYQLLWLDNASLELHENGDMKAFVYEPGRMYTADEMMNMLREGGMITGDAQAYSLNDGELIIIRTIYEQLPVSHTFSFDPYTGKPNYGVTFIVEQDKDGSMMSIEGRALGEAEVIWDSARVIPPEEAVRALAEDTGSEDYVNRIVLAYHVRAIPGDPFNVVLYPVWEIYTSAGGEMNSSIVNAITGHVEQNLAGAMGGTEEVAA